MSRCLKVLMGLLFTAALFAPVSLLAAAPAPVKKEKPVKVYAKISSVDTVKNTVTITGTNGKDTTYTVSSGTTISLDGESVKLSSLTADLRVDINVSVGKLTRLTATTPPEEKPDKPTAKKK
ncbi:MAG: hypothetical protein WCG79_10650 [Verrucomicrobiota bacterium]